ncbi:MAG: TM0106 family RecB-like putative nuclease [Nanoarchaeota archaeon]|nr:TM0106 family RecB-like putative nuclease [Nanoarchaeota archaeon]
MLEKCLKGKKEINGSMVLKWVKSPFTLYCDQFVNEKHKDKDSEYQKLLMKRGIEHESRVINNKYPESSVIDYENDEQGFKLLLEEMKKGTDTITGMPIFWLKEGIMGKPDVMEKKKGKSDLGNYHYIIKEIKLAKHIKKEHKMQAAFYNYIIGKIQGYTPKKFYLINNEEEEKECLYEEFEPELKDAIKEVRKILKGEKPSPTYNGCQWPWSDYCDEEATKIYDISLVGGVGPSTKTKLLEKGYKKVGDLAKAKIEDLVKIDRIGKPTAEKMVNNAKAVHTGKAIILNKEVLKFPKVKTEIFLDLEGTDQPDSEMGIEQMDYLIGITVRKNGKDKYTPFIAHNFNEEKKMFREFLDELDKYKEGEFIIYHWHNYEKTHIKKLMERHNIGKSHKEKIEKSMIDLYKVATKSIAFPTYGNGLKEIARFIGYDWEHEEIDALEAIAYYYEYVNDPKKYKEIFDKIIDYNRNDCEATMWIKDWLAKKA